MELALAFIMLTISFISFALHRVMKRLAALEAVVSDSPPAGREGEG